MAYGGINGDLLQECLCHTQVSCTQSSCPCGSPLLTHTSSGDSQTQFCLSLCAVSGSRCAQGMFQASEHLWRVWGLILIFCPPTTCYGFSFALGRGVCPQSCSNTTHLPLQCLPSCWGFSALRRGVSPHSFKALSKDGGVGDSPIIGMILPLVSIWNHPTHKKLTTPHSMAAPLALCEAPCPVECASL